VEAWVYTPGVPEGFTVAPSARFARVDKVLADWVAGQAAEQLPTQQWSTQEWLRFLRGLPGGITAEQMADLDQAFAFTQSGNSEILAQWLVTAIHADYQPAYPALESFLTSVGRRKFLVPLYEELLKTEQGKARARAIYSKARGNYHSVSVGTIDQLLGWPY
jgi:leukotriene-A4 hydrolase